MRRARHRLTKKRILKIVQLMINHLQPLVKRVSLAPLVLVMFSGSRAIPYLLRYAGAGLMILLDSVQGDLDVSAGKQHGCQTPPGTAARSVADDDIVFIPGRSVRCTHSSAEDHSVSNNDFWYLLTLFLIYFFRVVEAAFTIVLDVEAELSVRAVRSFSSLQPF